MYEERLDRIEQLAQFLELTAALSPRVFGGERKTEPQSQVKRVLLRFNHPHTGHAHKGARQSGIWFTSRVQQPALAQADYTVLK